LSLVSDLPQGSQLIGPPHADHAYETRRFDHAAPDDPDAARSSRDV
jgi:hypothetical protein